MAETFTDRLGLRIWGSGSDGPTRTEFNDIHQKIEANAAMFAQGLYADRPAAGKAGRFYLPTDQTGLMSYDTGAAWVDVMKGVVTPMTAPARNALSGVARWDGRLIANTTTDRLNYWDQGANNGEGAWVVVSTAADVSAATAALFLDGTLGDRPGAGVKGRFYLPTDYPVLFAYDTGSTWLVLAKQAIGVFTSSARTALAGSDLWDGRTIFNSTTDHLEVYDSDDATWREVALSSDISAALTPYSTTAQMTTAINNAVATRAAHQLTLVDVAGTTYTLQTSDVEERLIRCTSASPVTVSIPTNAAVAIPVGTMITVVQRGTGQVTFSPNGGVTLNSDYDQRRIAGQHCTVTLFKLDTNEWNLSGNLTA